MPHDLVKNLADDIDCLGPKLPHEFLFDNDNNSSKSKEYCNEEPRLLIDHQLSVEGSDFIQPFLDSDELKFVPLGTENIEVLNKSEIWVWNKIEQDDEWCEIKRKVIKCTDNPDHYDRTFSTLRGAKFKFHDEKNGQTLKVHIQGVFDCVNGVPVGIKDEHFTMMFQNESPFWCDPVVDYSLIDKTSNNASRHFPELILVGKTFQDVITMETTNNSHHYQIYIQDSKGIVLIQDLNTNKYWEPIENIKPIAVATLEEQKESDK